MKWFRGITISLVVLVLVAAFRPAGPTPHYVFKVRPSAKGVRLECVTGCKWTRLAATCETEPCEFVVDESGLAGSGQ